MTRSALVTGTSSGIGLSTAVQLAQAGFAVTATLRDPAKAGRLLDRARAEGVELDVLPLDVTDQGSVDRALAAHLAKRGGLDLLVNNAGAGYLGTLEQTPDADFRAVMETNCFGVARVTRAALPALRASRGRVVTVTSIGGLVAHPFNDAYCAAKFAVEGLMESLAPALRPLGVSVVLVEPGGVATDFVANLQDSLQARLADPADPYFPGLQAYLAKVQSKMGPDAQTPDQVAAVVVRAATDAEPRLRYLSSPAAEAAVSMKLADLTGEALSPLWA